MDISILDVLGPVMVGPSSSHTAGSLRLARAAAAICGKKFDRVLFELHGSLAKTGIGHGTHRALVAGVLGLSETDGRIKNSFELAEKAGVAFDFEATDLGDVHENTCRMTFFVGERQLSEVVGSSVGGGQILITKIDGISVEITADSPTLVISNRDAKGVIGAITSLLAENGVNIAVMRVNREARGELASTVIETDGGLTPSLADKLARLNNVLGVTAIDF